MPEEEESNREEHTAQKTLSASLSFFPFFAMHKSSTMHEEQRLRQWSGSWSPKNVRNVQDTRRGLHDPSTNIQWLSDTAPPDIVKGFLLGTVPSLLFNAEIFNNAGRTKTYGNGAGARAQKTCGTFRIQREVYMIP